MLFGFLAAACMILEVFMDLMQPTLLAKIIDEAIPAGIQNANPGVIWDVGKNMLLYAVLGFVGGASCSVFAALSGSKMGENLRAELFGKIQSLSFKEVDSLKTASLITRMTNDVTQLQTFVVMGLKMLIRAPLTCIGGVVMAYQLSGAETNKLLRVLYIGLPIAIVFMGGILLGSLKLFKSMQGKIDNINGVMRENLLGVRVIKAFNMEPQQADRFDGANNDLRDTSLRAMNRVVLLMPILNFSLNAIMVVVFWYAAVLSGESGTEVGSLVAFSNYLLQIMMSFLMVLGIMAFMTRAKISADRIGEVFKTDNSVKDSENATDFVNGDITFEHVGFRYYEGAANVLNDITFTISKGERLGIIGSTGSGKSTLVNLIPRLYDVTEGAIYINGVNIKDIRQSELRHKIGVALQENFIFSGTIRSNVTFGHEDVDDATLDNAVEISQTAEFLSTKPEGLESTIEQRGKNLSGGQKQRVSIARMLSLDPDIVILDDSSSALDVKTAAKLQREMAEKLKGRTVIEVAQRIATVMTMDRILVLSDNGEISGLGTHSELLANNPIYRSLAVSQLGEEVLGRDG